MTCQIIAGATFQTCLVKWRPEGEGDVSGERGGFDDRDTPVLDVCTRRAGGFYVYAGLGLMKACRSASGGVGIGAEICLGAGACVLKGASAESGLGSKGMVWICSET